MEGKNKKIEKNREGDLIITLELSDITVNTAFPRWK